MTNDESAGAAPDVAPDYNDFDTWRGIIAEHMQAGTVDDLEVFKDKDKPMRGESQKLSRAFNPWLEDETYWNGKDRPKLDSEVGKNIKDALQFGNDCVFLNWNAAYLSWVMDPKNEKFQALLAKAKKHPKTTSYRSFIADVMQAVGEDLALGTSRKEAPLNSNYYNATLPDTVQYKARMANGEWENISEDDLLKEMREPKGPHVVFCANHAFLDSKAPDVDSMGTAFTSLYEGALADPSNPDSPKLSAWDDPAGLDDSKTVMVMATNTAPNRFLNLADLFRRLTEIEASHKDPKKDTFKSVSPIAMQMVATILKSTAIESDVSKIHIARRDGARPEFVRPEFVNEGIQLDVDALNRLRRTAYTLFSKGGNDGRDAMRLLVHTLEEKGPNGRPLITMPKGVTTKDFVSSISMMVTGLNEEPMDEYYIEHGVLAPIYTNKPDPTAPIPAFPFNPKDPTYNFDGSAKVAKGHEPNQSVAGILADWRLHDQQRMAFAGTLSKAAITDINLVPGKKSGSYKPDVLSLEVAPGTTDAMMNQAMAALNESLGMAGAQVKRVENAHDRTRYELRGEGLVTVENIEKLRAALQKFAAVPPLSEQQPKAFPPADAPVWVSESITFEKLVAIENALELEQHKGGTKHPDHYRPLDVADPAKQVRDIEIMNTIGLENAKGEIHPRVERNLGQHPRFAARGKADGQQVG